MIGVHQLSVCLGDFALCNISFEIAAGEYAVLMGRTGSGKTTLLETICGLRHAGQGAVRLHGRDVSGLPPAARGIGYVPQDRALFNSMSVRDNLAFGLRVRKTSPALIHQRVGDLAELLHIAHLLDRNAHSLSGGEGQRVALGRALASNPTVLCLDEPLSALDDETRGDIHALLRSVHEQTKATILHVTHHLADAQKLATRLFVLRDGAVREQSPGQRGED